MNSLEKLKILKTELVADTGDIKLIKKYKPLDVTTNPSLILSLCNDPEYKHLLSKNGDLEETIVNFGCEIYKEIDGYVSTEVNPLYSFDKDKTIELSLKIIELYKKRGIDTNRILIKIASTWEGIKAAEILEKDHNIKCNMTLIFSIEQAMMCGESNVTLISPFVGRIYDWYKENNPEINEDMGVKNVIDIYNLYKKNNYKTIIMGASFRNTNQIKQLAGLDKLTISPKLIEDLQNDDDVNFDVNLTSTNNQNLIEKINKDDMTSDWFYNSISKNEMANSKLNEGINKFIFDTDKVRLQMDNL